MPGCVDLRSADFVEGWRRDEEDLGVVGGDVGVGDDARQVLSVLFQRDALGIDFLVDGCVVGAEEDKLERVSSWNGGLCDVQWNFWNSKV